MKPLIPYFEQPVIHIGAEPHVGGEVVLLNLPFDVPFVGHLDLYGFGVLVALGFLAGGKVAMDRARDIGLDPEAINRLIGWLVVGTFVGGHLGYMIMYDPESLSPPIDWMKVVNVFDGLSSYGGFFACLPLTIWFFRREKMPLWPYLDCIAIGLALGWALGRTGCFIAHDHLGSTTDFLFSVHGWPANRAGGTCPGDACHDMGLYEAVWSYCTFGLFLMLDRKKRVPGFYPCMLALLYAPTRFVMDFARPEHSDMRWFGLTGAQYGSIAFLLLGAYVLYLRMNSGDEPHWRDRPSYVNPEDAKESENA